METNQISRLRGMRDYDPTWVEANRSIADKVSSALAEGGYLPLDTPLLEQTDLFVRRSGGEIAGNLYTFTDPGGASVSLRPEFTPSVIRWHIENASERPGARRFRYSGPVLRYGGRGGGRLRQFTQSGGELIGVAEPNGDLEILQRAAQCLAAAGMSNSSLKVGHIGVVRDLVRAQGLSERLRMFTLSNLEQIDRGDGEGIEQLTRKAAAAGLVYPDDCEPSGAPADVDGLARGLDALGASLPGATGRRTPERIVARLVSRMRQASPESEFRSALRSVAALASERGSPSQALDGAARVMESCGASLAALEGLAHTLKEFSEAVGDASDVRLDLSFVRGLAYYTGIVFEFSADAPGGAVSLGGGGRYDELVRALGGADTPVCGFALDVDALARAVAAAAAGRAGEA